MTVEDAIENFRNDGFAIIEDALSTDQVAALTRALDELTGDEQNRIHNVADIFGRRAEFLDLIDLPAVLPVVQTLLGNNIWVNHSHYNVNSPDEESRRRDRELGYGWHRDGGVINDDLQKPAPLLSIKVAFYLSDLSESGRGQTYVIRGSHKTSEQSPGNFELPDSAQPICVSAGSAMLFDRRMIHSIRSPNESDIVRKAIFIQYAYRWMCAVDAMSVAHLKVRDPVRRQLLGMSTDHNVIDGAAGRSSRYYPTKKDIPLAGEQTPMSRRVAGALKRRISRIMPR